MLNLALSPILAQETPFSTSASQSMTELVSGAYDYLWQTAVNSGFYSVISNVGSLIGLCCLFFFIIQFAQMWLRDESTSWALGELILPLLVIVFLSNGGTLIGTTTLGLRNFINKVNADVIGSFNAEMSMQQSLSAVADFDSAYSQIVALREQCNVLIQQETMAECLKTQAKLAEGIVNHYQNTYQTPVSRILTNPWVTELRRAVTVGMIDPQTPLETVADAVLPDEVISTGIFAIKSAGSFATNLASSGVLRIVSSFLAACNGAFQYVIELSWVVTGLVAPIAVGLTLMPNSQGKPIIAWLTGFFGLGMCKLCLNLITGLYAFMIVKMGPVDALPHAIVLGILAPVLALLIAAGGGMAVFNGILSASQWAAGGVAGKVGR